jgi:hypothetical protein
MYIAFALVAAATMAAYAVVKFEQPPGFNELPDGWFERPTRTTADWRLTGVAPIRVESRGALNLEIVAEDRADLAASLSPAGGGQPRALAPGPGNTFTVTSGARGACPAARRADAPTLVLRTPRSVAIETKGAVAASAGSLEQLVVHSQGCSDWRIAGARLAWLDLGRGGGLHIGPVEDLRLTMAGRVTGQVGAVGRSLDVQLRGPARLSIGRINGMVDAELWGRPTLDLGPGFVGQEHLWLKGPGHIFHRGDGGIVSAEARLGGKIRIRRGLGTLSGAGDIQVGSAKAPLGGF